MIERRKHHLVVHRLCALEENALAATDSLFHCSTCVLCVTPEYGIIEIAALCFQATRCVQELKLTLCPVWRPHVWQLRRPTTASRE